MPEDSRPEGALRLNARADARNVEFFAWAFDSTAIAAGDPFLLEIDATSIEVKTAEPNHQQIGQMRWSDDPNDLSVYASAGTPGDPWPQLYIYYENGVTDDESYEYGAAYIDVLVTPEGEEPRLAQLNDLEEILNDIHELRGLPPEPSNTPEPLAETVTRESRTAYSVAKRGGLRPWGWTIVAVVLALVGALTMNLMRGPIPGGILVFVALGIAVWALSLHTRLASAVARERLAGYTTLNGAYPELDQRHPRTDAVIRFANSPMLSETEFAIAMRAPVAPAASDEQ